MPRRNAALLTVSVAAELAGMHAQTVRQYDRMGLVPAQRTRGGGRRYSLEDVDKLRTIQKLSQEEGISLAGIAKIFELQTKVSHLRSQLSEAEKLIARLTEERQRQIDQAQRIFAAGADGNVVLAQNERDLIEYLKKLRKERVQPSEQTAEVRKEPGAELTRYRSAKLEDVLHLLEQLV